jgi:hypothetical protein
MMFEPIIHQYDPSYEIKTKFTLDDSKPEIVSKIAQPFTLKYTNDLDLLFRNE